MDISDGLAGDLAKMLQLTAMTTEIAVGDVPLSDAARQAVAQEPALIASVLSGGDDYEILCAVAPAKAAAFETAARAGGVVVAAVGRARPGTQAPTFRTAQGPLVLASLSYQHF
jgi:thiamine-monophosphate kinase